jgi:HSP20 family protein
MSAHFDPLAELSRLESELSTMTHATRHERSRRLQPAIDVLDEGDAIVVMAELPGVKAADVRVHIDGDRVTIRASRARMHAEVCGGYYRLETRCGTFRRSFTLPARVDAACVEASLTEGILTLRLPKAAASH